MMKKIKEARMPGLTQLLLPLLLAIALSGCMQRPVVSPYPGSVERTTYPEIRRTEPVVPRIIEPEITQKGPGAPLYKKAQKFIAERSK